MTPGERTLRARAAAYEMHAKHGSQKAALRAKRRFWPSSNARSIPRAYCLRSADVGPCTPDELTWPAWRWPRLAPGGPSEGHHVGR